MLAAVSPRPGRISSSLLGRHLPDDQGALLDLLANVVKLLLALLLRTLLECHRRHLDQRYRPAAKIPNAPRGDWYTVPRAARPPSSLSGAKNESSGRGDAAQVMVRSLDVEGPRPEVPRFAHSCFSNTSRWWSSSSLSKQTLFALTPEVNASLKSALAIQRGRSVSLSKFFLKLGAPIRAFH